MMYASSSKSDAQNEALRQEVARVRTQNTENKEKVANLEAEAARLRSYANQSHKQVLRDCAQLQRVCELEQALHEQRAEGQRLRKELDAARAMTASLKTENQTLEATCKSQADSTQGLGRQCAKLQAEKGKLESLLEGSLLSRGAAAKTKGEAASELSYMKGAAARQKVTLQRQERQLEVQQRELGLLRQQVQMQAQAQAQAQTQAKKNSHKRTVRRKLRH